jgi:hypothetical protein
VGKVEGNYFKGRYSFAAGHIVRFQVYISSDNMAFKGTTTWQAYNRPLKGRRKGYLRQIEGP